MIDSINKSNASKVMLIVASFVIIVAGMKAAQPILVPFLLSVFIAIISSPLLYWLNRKKINMGVSLLIVIFCIIMASLLIGLLVGNSVKDFTASLPEYQEKLQGENAVLTKLLEKMGGDGDSSDKVITEYVNPGAVMGFFGDMLKHLGNILGNAFLIMITVIFILFEAATLPAKMNSAFGDSKLTSDHLRDIMKNINSYMVIKTYISLATGVLVALWLWILKVDYPLLWGLMTFMFNFIPNIGSIIVAVPAVLLAYIQSGTTTALLCAGGYVVFNMVMGNIIEPRFMGKGLGLSTLVVFLSLVFWGWVLGPVGMILSIPLTMTIKIALSSSKETEWVSILLGPPVHEKKGK
ncbi:AI-2E family transporter [Thermodesulfobacteriota bacterium]